VSDADTFEAIERHNVLIARRIAEYWRRQGIKTSPTKGPQVKLGPTGLPPGYRGEDAMRLRPRMSARPGSETLGHLADKPAAERTNKGQCLSFAAEPQAE